MSDGCINGEIGPPCIDMTCAPCVRRRFYASNRALAEMEHERDAYRSMCCDFVACMVPHPVEHPTMHAAWTKGKALLKDGPTPLAGDKQGVDRG